MPDSSPPPAPSPATTRQQVQDLGKTEKSEATPPNQQQEPEPKGEGRAPKTRPGVGMPLALLLDEFGALVNDAFGEVPYHVGSSLTGQWRDVDVRLMLDDERYEFDGYGDPDRPHRNPKWVAMVRAFSALGHQMTGLPIDFQIQQMSHANAKDGHRPRSALGVVTQMRRTA